MPTLMPNDTRIALGKNAERCDSRSLLLERFVYDHPEMNEARKIHFCQVCGESFESISTIRRVWEAVINNPKSNPKERERAQSFLDDTSGLAQRRSVANATCREQVTALRLTFLDRMLGTPDLLFGKLQSRLIVNLAGGVMENAGLCIDRFGVPYIPGSAVKGCARRMAIQLLLESPSDQKAELLKNIALIFGWGDTDWKPGRKRKRERGQEVETESHSDFWWAMSTDTGNRTADDERRNQLWKIVALDVSRRLLDILQVLERERPDEPWRDLPNYAGCVSFLPAYPIRAPDPDLELDVVTCHHRIYYSPEPDQQSDPNKWEEWKAHRNAPDTEEPVPVLFPAVAPGHVFAFAVVPIRHCDSELVKQARQWLKQGLEIFGLGAKTNAGYGWFDCSEELQAEAQQSVKQVLADFRKKQAEADAKRKAEEETAAKARAEKERLEKAPPHEKFKAEYVRLADEPFASQAKRYAEMNEDQRHGFILALKEKRETAKRWAKKKPDLIKPWQEFAKKLQPPIQLP